MSTFKNNFSKTLLFLIGGFFLISLGVFAPQFLGFKTSEARAVNLPTVTVDTIVRTQLLLVNSVYYVAFTSTTADGFYHIYFTSSTTGVTGTWSEPVLAYADNVFYNDSEGFVDFALAYNSIGGYFGLVTYATSTTDVVFSTSTNGSSWSTPVAIDDANLGSYGGLELVFSGSENYMAVIYKANTLGVGTNHRVATSTNGTAWSDEFFSDNTTYGGRVGISGSGGSRNLHAIYLKNPDAPAPSSVVYGLSANDGVTWTTTTIETSIDNGTGFVLELLSLAIDDNDWPGFIYFVTEDLTEAGDEYFATHTLHYAKKSAGGWTTSTVQSSIYDEGNNIQPALIFGNTDKPVLIYADGNFYPTLAFTTSSAFTTTTLSSDGNMGAGSKMSLVYNETSSLAAFTYVTGSGRQIVFATTSLDLSVPAANIAPTASAITPVQISANTVSLTTTVADADSDVTSLMLEYSLNNSTWASSTLGQVTVSEGSITTSTGSIIGIDTNLDGSVNLTIIWEANTDIANTDDTTVYFRIRANDGTDDSAWVTSAAFAVDTKAPTAPGALTCNTTSTISVTFNFGSVTVDNNFIEYKIFYKAGSAGVTELNTAFTSSSDANLGAINFNTVATTMIDGFATNTQYVFNIWAYDSWGRSASSTTELTLYTLATAPGTPIITASSTTVLNLVISLNSNSATTEFALCKTTNGTSCAVGGYVQADGSLGAAAVWQTYTVWGGASGKDVTGLSANNSYQFLAQARNGDNVETALSSANTAVYTLAATPNIASVVTSTAATTLDITLGADNGATTYAVFDSAQSKYLQANGTWGASAVWISYAGLGNGSATSSSGLSANTLHTIQVKGRNGSDVETSLSTGVSSYTLANAPGTPTVNNPAATTLDVTINSNSNPTATSYVVMDTAHSKYLQANGTWGASEVWITYTQLGAGSATTTSGLSTNTQYTIKVKAKNGDGIETAYSSTASLYTLATTPTAPTVNNPTASTLNIVVANDSATTYAVKVVYGSTTKYLQADGTLGDSAVWSTYTQLGAGSATTTSGLSANTAYTVSVAGKNGDGVVTSYTSATAVYTLASVPTSVSASADSISQITVSWSGDGIQYYVENTTAGTNSGWTSNTSYAFSSLTCNTKYYFRVKARNDDSADSGWASSVSATTNGCGGGGGGAPSAPAAPSTVASPVQTHQLSFSHPLAIMVGNVLHTVTASNFNTLTNEVTFVVESSPIIFTLKPGQEIVIDTDADKIPDTYIKFNSLSADKQTLDVTVTSLKDSEFFINWNLSTTDNPEVTLNLNSPQAVQMAISNTSNFAGVSFESYQKSKKWILPSGNGLKTVYVKLRTAQGGEKVVTASITLTGSTATGTTIAAPAVEKYIFARTLKSLMAGEDVKELQKYLNVAGFIVAKTGAGSIGKETTYFGAATKAALLKYQKANNLKQSGSLDKDTRDLINGVTAELPAESASVKFIFKSFLSYGMRGEEVRQLQLKLKEMGYFPQDIEANGNFGPTTKAAVVALQKDHNLKPVAGFVGPGTREVLNNF